MKLNYICNLFLEEGNFLYLFNTFLNWNIFSLKMAETTWTCYSYLSVLIAVDWGYLQVMWVSMTPAHEVEVTFYLVILGDSHSTLCWLFWDSIGKRFRACPLRPDLWAGVWLCHLLAVRCWTYYLNYVSLSSLIYKWWWK